MEVCALFLRQRGVRGVPDQDVAEPERLVSSGCGALRADQLLADQRHESNSQVTAAVGGRKLGDGRTLEHLAHHRCTTDEVAFRRVKTIQASPDKGGDRRGHVDSL